MTAFLITDDEWDVLCDERAEVFKVYCAIRRVMDYSTGVAGITYRISETMIRETIHVPAIRGRHQAYRPTRQQVRQPVQRLISLGLLVPRGALVFELPYARQDNSVSRKSNRRATNEQPDHQPENSLKQQDGYVVSATVSFSDDVLMSNLHPKSGYPEKPEEPLEVDSPVGGNIPTLVGDSCVVGASSSSPKPAPKKKTVRGTRLPDDWTLPDDWRAWAERERPELDVDREAAKFRDYWVARTGQGAAKRDWAATWRNWVRNAAHGYGQRYNAAAATYAEALGGRRR